MRNKEVSRRGEEAMVRDIKSRFQTCWGLISIVFLVTALVGSEACTNQAKPSGVTEQRQAPPEVTGATTAGAAALASLPQADPNFPEAQYVPLDSGYQVAELFYALSGMPPNYEALATAASQDFRSTNDEFRKRDILQTLMPKINQQILAYKNPQARYFTTQVARGLLLGHYDFDSASFPFRQGLTSDSYHYFDDVSNYTFSFTNGAAFEKFPVKDEQRAKQIEALITTGQLDGQAVGYVFAQSADPARNRVEFQIVKMALYGPEHRELGSY